MTSEIGHALRRLVRERANGCCEYCLMPDDVPLFPHEPDHIIAIKHGGDSVSQNLAYACFECYRAKGSDIAALDPPTRALVPLYHPRQQRWRDHFRVAGPLLDPLTGVGRATVALLRINTPARVAIRQALLQQGAVWLGRRAALEAGPDSANSLVA